MTTGARSVLVVTGGHRVDLVSFGAMFDAMCSGLGVAWEHAVQPDAQSLLHPGNAGRWDAIVFHDIAGLRLARGEEPDISVPDAATKAALRGLLEAGQGVVVTHHSLASWPAWDGWAHAIGGRFLYAPGTLDGRAWPASGYRMGEHHVRVMGEGHPVLDGVGDLDLDDELYLCPVFEDEVVPLLATDGDLSGDSMRSTYEEVRDGRVVTCDSHPPASRLVAWAKSAGTSPLVYLQPGHGPETFAHPGYRRLLSNAIAWVASPAAHEWATAHATSIVD